MKSKACLAAFVMAASSFGLNFSANAQQSLQAAFDFTKYGTVASGSTVTSNVYGNTTGILQASVTTLTGGGLAITAGGTNVGLTGLQLSTGALSAFTGDFSIQQFYTNTAAPGDNSILMGGTTSATQSANITNERAFFVGYSTGANKFVRPIEGSGGQYGATQNPVANTGNNTNTLNDLVITFSAATKTFTQYLNGAQVATGANTGFTTLSDVTNFSIAGVKNPAFGDTSTQETTSAFRFFTGTLTQAQVSALDTAGPTATLSQIGATGVLVPEPSTWVMSLGGMAALILLGRTRRRVS